MDVEEKVKAILKRRREVTKLVKLNAEVLKDKINRSSSSSSSSSSSADSSVSSSGDECDQSAKADESEEPDRPSTSPREPDVDLTELASSSDEQSSDTSTGAAESDSNATASLPKRKRQPQPDSSDESSSTSDSSSESVVTVGTSGSDEPPPATPSTPKVKREPGSGQRSLKSYFASTSAPTAFRPPATPGRGRGGRHLARSASAPPKAAKSPKITTAPLSKPARPSARSRLTRPTKASLSKIKQLTSPVKTRSRSKKTASSSRTGDSG